MVYHLLVASSAVALLAALWVGVQALVRRGSPEHGADSDVLACRTCGAGGVCGQCAEPPDFAAASTPVHRRAEAGIQEARNQSS